jgi:HAD superfamily hydrolase (TIGR01509 family)
MARDISTVVFDLDGVLVDSEHAWDAARRSVVAESSGSWKPDATRQMMGMSAAEWSRYLRDELGAGLEPAEINRRVVDRLLESYRRELPLLPGAVDAVRRLGAVYPLGLASAADRPVIDAVLRGAGIAECFKVTVSADEVSAGKPAPDVYLAALDRLGTTAVSSAAIEDSTNGLRAAAAAGMAVIAVPNREFPPAEEALALADVVLASLTELRPETIAGIE